MMMTGKDAKHDKLSGFRAGLDDYLVKPVDVDELCARVRALLRRSSGSASDVLEVSGLLLDPGQHRVSRNGEEIKLMPKEFALLQFLMRHPDQVFTQEALLERVWQSESDATPEAVRSCMKRLRQKIDGDSVQPIIEVITKVGYRLRKV
jgi:DNA-binding response OmpR family regulator